MAGGSFIRHPDYSVSDQGRALFALGAEMRSIGQRSSGFQDALAGNMGMAGNSLQQVMQPIGNALSMTAQQIGQLTQMLSRSPVVTGQALMGGAGVSPLHMMASYAGANVGMQAMHPLAFSAIAPMVVGQNASIALAGGARNMLTQTLPLGVGAAASLLPGGMFLGPAAALGAQIAMPGLLRMSGMDAALARPGMARMLQATAGDVFGGRGTVGRYMAGRHGGSVLADAASGFISEHQQGSTWGGFFGMDAAQYQPLVQAATVMSTPAELRNMVAEKGKQFKSQMQALVDISADLNMTFEQTAQLGMSMGAQTGGAARLRDIVRMANDVAEAGGITSRAGLVQFGVGVGQTAMAQGLDADTMLGSSMSLVREITRGAVGGQYARGQLESFGGATLQERAQNMALAMTAAGGNIAGTGFGRMLRANVLANGTTFTGGLMSGLATAGAVAVADPFALALSEMDPRTNALVTAGAPFAMIESIQSLYGGKMGAAATMRALQRSGLSAVQSGAVMNFYNQNKREFDARGGPGGGGRLMAAAAAYAAQTGSNIQDVLNGLRDDPDGTFKSQVLSGEVLLGRGKLGVDITAGLDIDAEARSAGMLSAEQQRTAASGYDANAPWTWAGGVLHYLPTSRAQVRQLSAAVGELFMSPEDFAKRGDKAAAEERERLMGIRSGARLTSDIKSFYRTNKGRFESAGFDVGKLLEGGIGEATEQQLRDLGISESMSKALSGGDIAAEDQNFLQSVLKQLAGSTRDQQLSAEISRALSDSSITKEELSGIRASDSTKSSAFNFLLANAAQKPLNNVNVIDRIGQTMDALGATIDKEAGRLRTINK